MPQNHSSLVHLVYKKLDGVPDKLCIFPAAEANKLETAGLSGSTMTAFFLDYVVCHIIQWSSSHSVSHTQWNP